MSCSVCVRMKQSKASDGSSSACGQIGNQGRTRVAGIEIENVAAIYSITKSLRVEWFLHLENSASDIRSVLRQKALDVVAIDRSAAIIAEVVAQRPSAAKRTEERGPPESA